MSQQQSTTTNSQSSPPSVVGRADHQAPSLSASSANAEATAAGGINNGGAAEASPPAAHHHHTSQQAPAPPPSGNAAIQPPRTGAQQHQQQQQQRTTAQNQPSQPAAPIPPPPAMPGADPSSSSSASATAPPPPSSTADPATAADPAAAVAAAGGGAAAQPARVRPALQLTGNLVQCYHETNERIFWKKRQEQPGPKNNDGYDDANGHYLVMSGEEIIQRYQVLETLGRGSFGTVVRCYDTRRKEVVAAKITRSGSGFRNQAKLEIDILMKILTQAPDSKTVRILKAFDWKGHLVIVFELLSFNLYQLMQCTNYHGVSLDLTSKFAFQLLMVLRDLERLNPPVIHCDLKPENVLLVNQNRSAIRVIDFGSACYQNRRMFRYIQSRYYRSPEVILGLEYGPAIDRWSLGCILVELHTGVALFDGRNEVQQLQRFEGLLGPIPAHMIAASPRRDNFYETLTDDEGGVKYRMRTPPEPVHMRTIVSVLERTQRRRQATSSSSSSSSTAASTAAAAAAGGGAGGSSSTSTSNQQQGGSGGGGTSSTPAASGTATGPTPATNDNGANDTADRYEQFIDLIKRLLEYDPARRIGVLPAMEHPFLCEFMPYYVQRTQQQAAHQQSQQAAAAAGGGAAAPALPPSYQAPQQQQQGGGGGASSSSSASQQQSSQPPPSCGNECNNSASSSATAAAAIQQQASAPPLADAPPRT